MEILYEDKHIVVAIKPVGILSQADSGGKESMVSVLSDMCKSNIYPLHRLDRDVSGVMVYAKTKFAAQKLSTDIAEKRFLKVYVATVHGVPKEQSGTMQDLLFHDSRKNKTYVVKRERKGVKEALLEYTVIKTVQNEDGARTTARVVLHTGRTHQIRVQFASRGMSLVGDRKYGARDDAESIALYSHEIGFYHPETNEYLSFVYNNG
jgi:23S rRNA pseudouridine1911/1915/1917 synthase